VRRNFRVGYRTPGAIVGSLRRMAGPDITHDPAPRTPEEMVLHRLRMVGLGLLVVAVMYDGAQIYVKRFRALRTRIITGVNPLDPPGSMFVAGIADCLSTLDGSAQATKKPS
jgi:hypothetical protein